MWSLRLKARSGIGIEFGFAVEAEAVQAARNRGSDLAAEVAAALCLKLDRERSGARQFAGAGLQHGLDALAARRPDPEMNASFGEDFRPNGQSPLTHNAPQSLCVPRHS